MDHQEQHHQHHQKEREHEKKLQKEHEHREEKNLASLHPAWWFLITGGVLLVAIVLVWTFVL